MCDDSIAVRCTMSETPLPIDAVIVGGGVAGLFALHALSGRGHSVCLVERTSLGDGQSVCAQGIVHGGVKYSLGGLVSGSARAIERMPERWLAMADRGEGTDLSGAPPLARSMWLWRSEGIGGAFAMAGARLSLRAKPQSVPPADRPEPLKSVRGDVMRMPEPVFDMMAVLRALAGPMRDVVVRGSAEPAHGVVAHGSMEPAHGGVVRIRGEGCALELRPRAVVLAAGGGNGALRELFGAAGPLMQLRPLHQAMVRGPLPEFHGHCVDGLATRVTVTSAEVARGERVWHIGGKLAEEGVARDAPSQRAHAMSEMRSVLPAVDFARCSWSTYTISRAEREQPGGARPEDACVESEDAGPMRLVTVWPTKMALAPVAADMVTDAVGPSVHGSSASALRSALGSWPRPEVAPPPWARAEWVPTAEIGR